MLATCRRHITANRPLRDSVTKSAFLQVTVTSDALYLQPDDEVVVNGDYSFKAKASGIYRSPSHSQQVRRRR